MLRIPALCTWNKAIFYMKTHTCTRPCRAASPTSTSMKRATRNAGRPCPCSTPMKRGTRTAARPRLFPVPVPGPTPAPAASGLYLPLRHPLPTIYRSRSAAGSPAKGSRARGASSIAPAGGDATTGANGSAAGESGFPSPPKGVAAELCAGARVACRKHRRTRRTPLRRGSELIS